MEQHAEDILTLQRRLDQNNKSPRVECDRKEVDVQGRFPVRSPTGGTALEQITNSDYKHIGSQCESAGRILQRPTSTTTSRTLLADEVATITFPRGCGGSFCLDESQTITRLFARNTDVHDDS